MEKENELELRATTLWNQCLRLIKDNITPLSYQSWFLPIKPLKLEDKTLTLVVPSQFFYDCLNVKFIYTVKPFASFQLEESINRKTIIDISSQVNEKMIEYFSKHPHELKVMNRRLFEEFIAELFNGFGFNVELTQKTRDGGRDIIAIKYTEIELKYLIECKRPDPGNNIGIKPVRELFGVKEDEKATKAILASTTYFSKEARMFYERNKWELELKDFNGIMKWIDTYKRIKNLV